MAIPSWCVDLVRSARTRARVKDIPFNIEPEDVYELFNNSYGRCQLTGILFEFDDGKERDINERRPYLPSLDRIKPSIGYTKGNIRLVCSAVNIAMNTWGFEVLLRISAALCGEESSVGKRKNLYMRRRHSKRYGIRWEAKIKKMGQEHHLGTFNTPLEVIEAYDRFMLGEDISLD